MKKNLALLIAIAGWFAVIAQLFLLLSNHSTSTWEALVRFVSYFTILTNTLVAGYFTFQVLDVDKDPEALFNRPGTLTAITVYISIVGLVYQVALRHIWDPTGLQKIVDELLHTIIPLLVVVYWFRHETHPGFDRGRLGNFLIYPLAYLGFVLVRGAVSGFYPYPFLEVDTLGWPQTTLHIAVLVAFFLLLFLLYTYAGTRLQKRRSKRSAG
jgi:hypothetical protein